MKIRNKRHLTKFLYCDNAGENIALLEVCDIYGVNPEMTSPDTPQQNGVAERAFTVIRQKAVSMMEIAKFSPEMKGLLWAESMSTATLLTNITRCSMKVENKSSHEMLYGSKPSIMKHLKTFWNDSIRYNARYER